MNAFSSPADRTGVPPADSIVPSPAGVSCGSSPQQDVGQDRLSHFARIAEDRLDALIARLGEQSANAMRQGDPTGARLFSDQMTAAIKSRSPEHKARLHEELERRINEGADFFQWQGRLAAELLAKRGV